MRKLGFILAIVTAITVLLAGCNTSSNGGNKPATPPQAATITKAEYDQIDDKSTYEDAVKIIGGEGKIISESGTKGNPDYSVTYQFPAEGKENANAKLTFRNNKLISKSESGL
ncbi:DUF3862 domain-containing protein [Paenibacillus rigui]|uniref:DUF3862 domain-containing protein n=1 Tax=Paenibacillus rigui TaxID=554312 RepID=A0A229UL28_9BACL|nr:DUF3862 domain-containing protein [Paenibacillus rigui]OXM84083.1 hypothetical protein CF651_21815 [Paenibacillus rigui]